jgi:DNA (cytosine-5)-methyltransferase 1
VSKRAPTAIDLFAGAGGATSGLRAAGFKVIYAVELDKYAAESYRLNHPRVDLAVDDLHDVDPARVLRRLRLEPGELSMLKACPPCQSYSTLGKGDVSDERNDLVATIADWIATFRPAAFVLENVTGLRNDARLERVVRRARRMSYGVRQYVVDAAAFGVPQRRRRLIVVGVKGLPASRFPPDLTSVLPDGFGSPWRTAGDVLVHAGSLQVADDDLDRSRQSSPAVVERIKAIPLGGSRADLPRKHRLRCHADIERTAATSVYGRIRPTEPAPTMTTRCTTPACGRFIHPFEHRGLTLREAALIQTFPDDYKFAGGYDCIERQIGNAVPVKMAEGVGIAVRQMAQAAR